VFTVINDFPRTVFGLGGFRPQVVQVVEEITFIHV
jgi:hypothetical protein